MLNKIFFNQSISSFIKKTQVQIALSIKKNIYYYYTHTIIFFIASILCFLVFLSFNFLQQREQFYQEKATQTQDMIFALSKLAHKTSTLHLLALHANTSGSFDALWSSQKDLKEHIQDVKLTYDKYNSTAPDFFNHLISLIPGQKNITSHFNNTWSEHNSSTQFSIESLVQSTTLLQNQFIGSSIEPQLLAYYALAVNSTNTALEKAILLAKSYNTPTNNNGIALQSALQKYQNSQYELINTLYSHLQADKEKYNVNLPLPSLATPYPKALPSLGNKIPDPKSPSPIPSQNEIKTSFAQARPSPFSAEQRYEIIQKHLTLKQNQQSFENTIKHVFSDKHLFSDVALLKNTAALPSAPSVDSLSEPNSIQSLATKNSLNTATVKQPTQSPLNLQIVNKQNTKAKEHYMLSTNNAHSPPDSSTDLSFDYFSKNPLTQHYGFYENFSNAKLNSERLDSLLSLITFHQKLSSLQQSIASTIEQQQFLSPFAYTAFLIQFLFVLTFLHFGILNLKTSLRIKNEQKSHKQYLIKQLQERYKIPMDRLQNHATTEQQLLHLCTALCSRAPIPKNSQVIIDKTGSLSRTEPNDDTSEIRNKTEQSTSLALKIAQTEALQAAQHTMHSITVKQQEAPNVEPIAIYAQKKTESESKIFNTNPRNKTKEHFKHKSRTPSFLKNEQKNASITNETNLKAEKKNEEPYLIAENAIILSEYDNIEPALFEFDEVNTTPELGTDLKPTSLEADNVNSTEKAHQLAPIGGEMAVKEEPRQAFDYISDSKSTLSHSQLRAESVLNKFDDNFVNKSAGHDNKKASNNTSAFSLARPSLVKNDLPDGHVTQNKFLSNFSLETKQTFETSIIQNDELHHDTPKMLKMTKQQALQTVINIVQNLNINEHWAHDFLKHFIDTNQKVRATVEPKQPSLVFKKNHSVNHSKSTNPKSINDEKIHTSTRPPSTSATNARKEAATNSESKKPIISYTPKFCEKIQDPTLLNRSIYESKKNHKQEQEIITEKSYAK